MFKIKNLLFALAIASASLAFAQVTIDSTNWPYGADQIGNHWNYHNTSSNVAVNIAALNPYAQGGNWDFTTGPTGVTASSVIHVTADAPSPPPANTSFVENQTASGNTQWLYEDETGAGTWARGISQGGTIYPYNSPQYNIYHYPMTMGTTWSSTWTWNASGITIQSTRSNEIVGWGSVSVPHGGPLSCLVIRQLYTDYGEFQGIPVIDEAYRIYEWIVPNIGSVATIQSVNHETNWYYNTAAAFFRLYDSNLGGDLIAPSITNVTQLTDTPNPGPYIVYATITDSSGIDSAALYYSVAGGAYNPRGPESINGDVYEFEIPMMTGSPVQQVRYYIWARDASANQNIARNPANAPATYFSFNWINDNLPPQFSNVTVWPSPTYFNGPYPVYANITDDNGILFASLHYRFGAGAWQEAGADSNEGSLYHFTIPAITATTIIRYYLEAVDNSGFFNTGFHPAAGMNGPIVFQAVYSTPADPQSIDNLTIWPSGNDARLNWSDVTQDVNGNPVTISHYDIYRGVMADGSDLTLIGTSTTSGYLDVGAISASAKYFYNVRAVTP